MQMDEVIDLVSEDDIASYEETSSEDTVDVKVCDVCGNVGEEKKLAVCSRCNDGAVHIYCMLVMLQEVPERRWLCDECQAEVEIEIEKKKLEKSQANFVMVSMENKVDAEKAKDASNVARWNKRLNRQSEANFLEEIKDVKVCDICGDVGEVEKLTVCGRCNGAEHVYCMQVMMEKVPDVMWLCEACQTEVEFAEERTELEKSQVMVGACKLESFGGQTNKPVDDANSGSYFEDEMEAAHVSSKNSNMRNQSNGMTTKRIGDDATITLLIGKDLSESGGVSMEGDSAKRAPLSRKNSLKLDTEKGKEPARPMPTPLTLNALKNQAPPLCGPLPKSISFKNSKVPKVKQLVTEVPQKPKNLKEPISLITKQDGPVITLAKSTSVKKLNSSEPMKGIQIPDTSLVDKIKNPPSLKPAGHSTQFCPVGRSSLFVTKPLSEQTSDRTARCNRTSEATTLTATEDILKSAYQSEPSPKRRRYHNPSYKPINVLCTSISHEESSEQDRPAITIELINLTGVVRPSSKATFVETPFRGCFEIWRTGRSSKFCKGLQGHLSCSASQKVLEIAKKFPSKIRLEQLPRRNIWPPQFHGNGLSYDSIGLFFFAQDIQSYERHYSKLVEWMLKGDLALRGNIETAELLIFPSNILPKSFQRWNMSYYLWGVFRVRRKDSNLPYHVPTRKHCNFNGNLLAVGRRTHAHASSGPSFYYSPTCEDSPSIMPLEANHEGCPNGENSLG
ncbi:Tyrosine-protein kinase BAZ1B [Triticum urartu]|uniref:Tyrosine-protein kinase BAZ1B n=1 Tax=Triticum urartu TaxID=4572 RepID=M7YZ55_TRIUA|nr:Tyrosine-protein kinase BAZ1B [Triticum urartu]